MEMTDATLSEPPGYLWQTPTIVDPSTFDPTPIANLGASIIVQVDPRVMVIVDENGAAGPLLDGSHWMRSNGGYVTDLTSPAETVAAAVAAVTDKYQPKAES